jgi:uncharacterized protein (DUF362 family)/Pyruvate/2-oxoacid:ferredoxin oxidoreductase delta subunit
MPQVMIESSDYENVRSAVDKIFTQIPLRLSNKNVLIKPNALRASEAQEGIVTHPSVLRAVVEAVEAMQPADIIVGDNTGAFSYGDNEACFQKTGLMEASKGYYRNIGNDAVKLKFNPDFMPEVSVSRAILEADIFISVPKFKTHGLTVISGAIKNSYGILPGAQKARLHKQAGTPERFHDMMVEVFQLRVPDLFIVDAVVGMEGNGPTSPDLREIGLILASDNAVALDAVIAEMMGLDPGRLRFLQKAKAAGLGDFDREKIDIVGELKRLPHYQIPPLGGEASMENQAIQEFLTERTQLRPKADPDLCTSCESCIDQCPVSALSMIDDIPVVTAEMCITCFCCQEICPEKALVLV